MQFGYSTLSWLACADWKLQHCSNNLRDSNNFFLSNCQSDMKVHKRLSTSFITSAETKPASLSGINQLITLHERGWFNGNICLYSDKMDFSFARNANTARNSGSGKRLHHVIKVDIRLQRNLIKCSWSPSGKHCYKGLQRGIAGKKDCIR